MISHIFYGPFRFAKNLMLTLRSPLFVRSLILSLAYLSCPYNVTMVDNNKLHSLAATHGIHIRFSCPYTSQQNGKAERIIRTVNDIVRYLLF